MITNIHIHINEDTGVTDYFMAQDGSPVHWSNKKDTTELWFFQDEFGKIDHAHDNTLVVSGVIPFDTNNPEESIQAFYKVLLLQ